MSLVFIFQLLNYTFSFFFTPFLSRKLMYDEFATYSQVATISEFTNVLLGFGLGIIIYKMLSMEKKDHETVIRTCFQLAMFTFLGVSLLAFLFKDALAGLYNNPFLSHAIVISLFYIGVGIPINILSSVMIFHGRLRPLYITSTLSNLGRFLVLYLATRVFHNFDLIFIGFTVLNLLTLLVYHQYSYRYIRGGRFDMGLLKKMLKDGIPLSANSILGKFIFLTGGIFVSQLIGGTKSFAIYRNGAFEMPFISTIYSSLSIIIFPEVAKMIGSGQLKEVVSFKKKVSFNTAMVVYPAYIFFVFFGQEFITIYLSEKFRDSAAIFIVFNALLLLRINDYEDILINLGKSKTILIVYVATVILNAVLNYVLIYYFGAIGGAIATPLSIFAMIITLLLITCKVLGNKVGDYIDFGRIMRITAISIVTGFFIKVLPFIDHISLRLIGFGIKGLLFFGILVFIFYKMDYIDSRLLAFIKGRLTIKKRSPDL